MQFMLLGPLHVTAGDEEVRVGPPRQQALLAVLLLHRHHVLSAERLVHAIWGDEPGHGARSTLKAHVSRLRGVLAQSAGEGVSLETRRPGYVLHVPDEDVDVARFERLAAEGHAALARGQAASAAETLREALALWRGAALAGLADQSEMLAAEATRLEELRLAALGGRVQADLWLGGHEELVGELEALVADYPFRESLWGHLMVALYRAGRQADALAAYERASSQLADELGVDPSEALRKLQEQILCQDPSLATPAPAREPAASVERFRLPASREAPVGREREAEAVEKALSESRLVTLTGPGGAGKTTLALHVGRLVQEHFGDGAVLVDLASVEDPADVGGAVLAALGAKDHIEEQNGTSVVHALGAREVLVVADNCEHVLDAVAELIDATLAACPRVHVLATSRQPLDVPGERRWPVTSLPVPAEGADSTQALRSPAVALFIRRAQAVDPHFRLSEDEVPTAARIVRELDGLPLAIELAAVRVTSLSLEEIAAHLQHRFRLLRGGRRRGPARQQTLENALAWSEQLLTDVERRTLARLAALPGGAGVTTARRVAFEENIDDLGVVDVLDGLARKSLLNAERSAAGTRYRMLESVRAYFLERLHGRGESEPTRRRLAGYVLELAQEAGQAIRSADPTDALARLDDELANLAAVRSWALGEGEPEVLFRLVTALPLVAEWRIRAQVYDVMDAAAEAAERLDHPEWPAVAAATSVAMTIRGDPARARRQLTVALDRLPAGHALRPVAWLSRVHLSLMVGETETGVEAARACLDERHTKDDRFLEAFARSSLALALVLAGRRPEALAELETLGEISDGHESLTLAAWCAYVHGEVLGDEAHEQAQRHYQQAVELGRRCGADAIIGVALIGLSSLEARHGEPAWALPAFAEALTHHLRGGRWQECWGALLNLVQLFVRVGEYEATLEILGAAETSPTCPPAYGEAAARQAAVSGEATHALGDEVARRARMRGAGRDDTTVVRMALATIAQLQQDHGEARHGRLGRRSPGSRSHPVQQPASPRRVDERARRP